MHWFENTSAQHRIYYLVGNTGRGTNNDRLLILATIPLYGKYSSGPLNEGPPTSHKGDLGGGAHRFTLDPLYWLVVTRQHQRRGDMQPTPGLD